jgi:hypothetical protein
MSQLEESHKEQILKNPYDGFDLRTEIRDPKSGMVLKYQPYRAHHFKVGPGESTVVYERDGKFYFADGTEAPDPKVEFAAWLGAKAMRFVPQVLDPRPQVEPKKVDPSLDSVKRR